MINVYHIVYNKFFRVHFPFKDNKYIKNILVIDGQIKFSGKLDFVETGYKLVKHENVHFTEFKHTHILIHAYAHTHTQDRPDIDIDMGHEHVHGHRRRHRHRHRHLH
jgi:hypothetical protein